MKIIKEATGTDKAKEALSNYIDDIEYLTDQVLITIRNTEWLANDIANKRKPVHSLVWQALLEIIRFNLGEPLTSSQLQAGFRALGIDYKEFLKPVVERIEEERKDALEESKGTLIEILDNKTEKLDKDATVTDIFNILDDINNSDIAMGLRSAIKYGLVSNKVVDYIISYAKNQVIKPDEMKNESLQTDIFNILDDINNSDIAMGLRSAIKYGLVSNKVVDYIISYAKNQVIKPDEMKNESLQSDEVAKIIDKIQELETELEVISNDKEIDKKQIKSIKDKISRLNKKLNEDKDIAEELNLNEDKDKNIENIKSALKASGIKNERTLDLMSKDVLKTLQSNYDKDCMDQEGNYYNPAITSAIQDVIERITNRRPKAKIGEGRVKELLFANKNVNEDLDEEEINSTDDILSELQLEGKVYLNSQEDGYVVLSRDPYPQRPEEFDEGYVTGWNKGENPEFDKEQEERFREATEAYEDGDVFQFTSVSDDTVVAVAYGEKELKELLDSMDAKKVNIRDLMR